MTLSWLLSDICSLSANLLLYISYSVSHNVYIVHLLHCIYAVFLHSFVQLVTNLGWTSYTICDSIKKCKDLDKLQLLLIVYAIDLKCFETFYNLPYLLISRWKIRYFQYCFVFCFMVWICCRYLSLTFWILASIKTFLPSLARCPL